MLPESTDTFSHVSNIPLDYDDGPFRARYYIGLVHWSLGDDLNSPAAEAAASSLSLSFEAITDSMLLKRLRHQ